MHVFKFFVWPSSTVRVQAHAGTGSIDVHAARSPLARHEARNFSPARARHDTVFYGPGLAWPDT